MVENLLTEWGGKSASLSGPTHLWNLLKMTTLLVYLALLFYLAPENMPKKKKKIIPNFTMWNRNQKSLSKINSEKINQDLQCVWAVLLCDKPRRWYRLQYSWLWGLLTTAKCSRRPSRLPAPTKAIMASLAPRWSFLGGLSELTPLLLHSGSKWLKPAKNKITWIKISKNQNDFMKTSFFPKYQLFF